MRTVLPTTIALTIALLSGCSSKPGLREGGGTAPAFSALKGVDGARLPIGRGRTVAIVSYRLTRVEQVRDAKFPGGSSRPVPGRTLADPDVALIQVLDVDNRLPEMFARRIEKQFVKYLEAERKRLAGEIADAGFKKADRLARRALFYALDMDGLLVGQLGLSYGRDGVATVLLDGGGHPVLSRAGAMTQGELVAALGRFRQRTTGAGHAVAPTRTTPLVVLQTRCSPHPSLQHPETNVQSPGTQPRASDILIAPVNSANLRADPAAPKPSRLTAQDPAPSKLRENDRALLTGLVTSGTSIAFTGHKAVFQPKNPPKTTSRPGAFEDAAIEAEVRARLAANPGLAGRSITVRSRGGSVEISGKLDDLGIVAAALNAALSTPGVFDAAAEIR